MDFELRELLVEIRAILCEVSQRLTTNGAVLCEVSQRLATHEAVLCEVRDALVKDSKSEATVISMEVREASQSDIRAMGLSPQLDALTFRLPCQAHKQCRNNRHYTYYHYSIDDEWQMEIMGEPERPIVSMVANGQKRLFFGVTADKDTRGLLYAVRVEEGQ